jgi:hypothetical protein
LIEIIDLDSSISTIDVIPDYTNKTRIVGFFKLGFLVSNFDNWINHLTRSNVEFYGDVVMDETTGNKIAIILDPDGNRIQIFEK